MHLQIKNLISKNLFHISSNATKTIKKLNQSNIYIINVNGKDISNCIKSLKGILLTFVNLFCVLCEQLWNKGRVVNLWSGGRRFGYSLACQCIVYWRVLGENNEHQIATGGYRLVICMAAELCVRRSACVHMGKWNLWL